MFLYLCKKVNGMTKVYNDVLWIKATSSDIANAIRWLKRHQWCRSSLFWNIHLIIFIKLQWTYAWTIITMNDYYFITFHLFIFVCIQNTSKFFDKKSFWSLKHNQFGVYWCSAWVLSIWFAACPTSFCEVDWAYLL